MTLPHDQTTPTTTTRRIDPPSGASSPQQQQQQQQQQQKQQPIKSTTARSNRRSHQQPASPDAVSPTNRSGPRRKAAVTPTNETEATASLPKTEATIKTTRTTNTRTSITTTKTTSTAAAAPQDVSASAAQAYKDQGNAAFAQQKYAQALEAYTRGIEQLSSSVSPSDPSSSSSDPSFSLLINLYANRIMVYLKQDDYATAQTECTRLLQSMHQQNNPKIWYRRALARVGQAEQMIHVNQKNANEKNKEQNDDKNHNSNQKHIMALLELAKLDLQASLKSLEQQGQGPEKNNKKKNYKDDAETQSIAVLANKIQTHMQTLEGSNSTTNQAAGGPSNSGNRHRRTSQSPRSTATSPSQPQQQPLQHVEADAPNNNREGQSSSSPVPMPRGVVGGGIPAKPDKQRHDVMQLLSSRWRALQTKSHNVATSAPTSSASSSSSPDEPVAAAVVATENATVAAAEGEAMFLIEWTWWCHWCAYVGFLPVVRAAASTTSLSSFLKPPEEAAVRSILSLLPPGASLPTVPPQPVHGKSQSNPKKKSDEQDSDTSDDDDNDDAKLSFKGPPGPIDNLRLLVWEMQPFEPSAPTTQTFHQQWSYNVGNCPENDSYDTLGEKNCNDQKQLQQQQQHSQTNLLPNLVRGYHYEVLPREVYNALRSWYGEVTPSICRRVILNGNQAILSLYPRPSVLHPAEHGRVGPPPPRPFLTSINRCSACQAPNTALCRCTRCLGARYCNRVCQESHWPFHKLQCRELSPEEEVDLRQNDMLEFPLCDGRVGLNNVGNTCFMNSALQCLSHTTPLTRHFLSNRFMEDLNPSNPLGTGGKLASAYEIVLKDLWMRGGRSTSPTALKRAIALFAPRFAGCLQHDSQEFLAYLLDGLHEDLNRIRQAPYVEMPDVTQGQNMAVAGARAWDAHRRRNDSLVMDTFYGQFKSTCVCPQCNRVSVSFDVFNHVSLEIPQPKMAPSPMSILVVRPPDLSDIPGRPVRYGVEIDHHSSVADLRASVAQLCGIADATNIVICEVNNNVIMDVLNDTKLLSRIQPTELLVAYQVDSFNSSSFHLIASHVFASSVNGSNDVTGGKPETFGIPFMTSFSSDYTCRQVWEHIWSMVASMVAPAGKEYLRIRVHDGHDNPVEVFPSKKKESANPAEESHEEGTAEDGVDNKKVGKEQLTAVLPSESDEPLRSFLGVRSVESFVFVWLEWDDSSSEDAVERPVIDEDRFVIYDTHPSYAKASQAYFAQSVPKGVTLGQCFEKFTRPERLDEQNMWYCSTCKEHVRALKTMELWRLPNVLIVHLKRFEFKHALRRDKLDTFVDFPIDGLDMSVYCSRMLERASFVDERIPAIYDLFAVVNHFGRMGFGHYTAFARRWDETGISGKWALFDDSSVGSVNNGNAGAVVTTPAAYVLFYRRRDFN